MGFTALSLGNNTYNIDFPSGVNLLRGMYDEANKCSKVLQYETNSKDGYHYWEDIYAYLYAGVVYTLTAETDGMWVTHGQNGSPSEKRCSLWVCTRSTHTQHISLGAGSGCRTFTVDATGEYCIRTNSYSDGSTKIAPKFWNIKITRGETSTKDWTPCPFDYNYLREAHVGPENGKICRFTAWPDWESLKTNGYIDANYGGSLGYPDEEFLKAISKWAIDTYKNRGSITLIGSCCPNSSGTCILHLYSSSGKHADTQLPRYCRGTYHSLGGSMYQFGTYDYSWTYGLINAGYAASSGKLSTARTLTIGNTGKSFDGSTNVSWTLNEIGAMPAGDTSHAIHVPGIKSAGSVCTLDWNTNSNYVPDLSLLAHWNGAYSGSSSNLKYSANGTIIGSNNIGDQSVNYANSAGSAGSASSSGSSARLYSTSSPLTNGHSLFYYSGQPAVGTANGNAAEGSNAYNLWSYPKDGAYVANGVANVMITRLHWGTTYFHDIFTCPNKRYVWHRWVNSGTAKNWSRFVLENNGDATENTEWNIAISGTARSSIYCTPWYDINNTTTYPTVKAVKDKLVEIWASDANTGIGKNVIVPASAISQWGTDSAATYPSSVYSMIKIGGGYNSSTYGQYLLSTYASNRIGYIGRNSNSWTALKWIATTDDLTWDSISGKPSSFTPASHSHDYAASTHTHTTISNDLSVTGKVSASQGFYESSDERLKDFQNDLKIDFDVLKSIPKKYFNFKDNPDKLEIGTSAQEVQKHFPELVSESDGYLSVDYAKLSIVALAAVDEMNDKIERLENELADIKQLLKNLIK